MFGQVFGNGVVKSNGKLTRCVPIPVQLPTHRHDWSTCKPWIPSHRDRIRATCPGRYSQVRIGCDSGIIRRGRLRVARLLLFGKTVGFQGCVRRVGVVGHPRLRSLVGLGHFGACKVVRISKQTKKTENGEIRSERTRAVSQISSVVIIFPFVRERPLTTNFCQIRTDASTHHPCCSVDSDFVRLMILVVLDLNFFGHCSNYFL